MKNSPSPWKLLLFTFIGLLLIGAISRFGGKNDADIVIPKGNSDNLDSIKNSIELKKTVKLNNWKNLIDSVISLPKKTVLKTGSNTYSGLSFKIGNRFIFDRYDDRYHLFDAQRGEKFITANISVTSTQKDPALHSFGVYYLDSDSSLRLIGEMQYRFSRWEDYGTYLGNYADNTNDFAYKETVKFALGLSVSTEILNKKIFIISKATPSFLRKVERFDNPPVSYVSSGDMLTRLSSDEDWNDHGYVKICTLN